jgi:hypothetical protein
MMVSWQPRALVIASISTDFTAQAHRTFHTKLHISFYPASIMLAMVLQVSINLRKSRRATSNVD